MADPGNEYNCMFVVFYVKVLEFGLGTLSYFFYVFDARIKTLFLKHHFLFICWYYTEMLLIFLY